MKQTRNDLQTINFTENNRSIIYAPNSTGKTRLTNKLAARYKNDSAMFFTADEIDKMLTFSGRQIFVGSDSQKKLENEKIIKEYNNCTFGDEILAKYGVKNASSLVKTSLLFNTVELKKKDTFDIYSKLVSFSNGFSEIIDALNTDQLVALDKSLSKINFEEIKYIASDNIKSLSQAKDKIISDDLKKQLSSIAASIDSKQLFCPLCGQVFESNKSLKETIKKTLSKYVINRDIEKYEKCVVFLNTLNEANLFFGSHIFETHYDNVITTDLLLNNILTITELLRSLSNKFVKSINNQIDSHLFDTYSQNQKAIEKEQDARQNNDNFCSEVLNVIRELITLPDGYFFKRKNDKVCIVDSNDKIVEAKNFLSESEQKRMCISIVFAEIKQRQLQYVVFDDPVDINDDYYFDISVNVIGDMILNETRVNWIVLTHEFRMISILSDRCRTSNDLSMNNIKFLFYLPDPSYGGNGLPPFNLIDMKPGDLGFLNEHETIIFRKIFSGVAGYKSDKKLALLSSFNTARNLYNDLLKNHSISKHELKRLRNCISAGNQSYEHYKTGKNKIMRMSTLSIMNETMYTNCDPSYLERSKAFASNYREKYVQTTTYSSIYCDNPILKYILYAMVRVMNSHYVFEKKLASWAANQFGSLYSSSGFESAFMLSGKLNYVKGLCGPSDMPDFNKYSNCFSKWRGLLNDFAHSTARMVPPYLTISPIEMFKLEQQIKLL